MNRKSLPATEARRGLDGYSPRQEGHGQMVRPSACVSKAGMAGLPYPGCMAKILASCEMKLQEILCNASMRATGSSVKCLGHSRSVPTNAVAPLPIIQQQVEMPLCLLCPFGIGVAAAHI